MNKGNIKYTNGEITVLWQPDKCIHSAVCVKGLPGVFRPSEKPWVKMEAGSSEQITAQVKKCPSGALSLAELKTENEIIKDNIVIECAANGPYLVKGKISILKPDGTTEEKENAALCRCGASSNKPFCDGTHRKTGFEG